KAFKNGQDDSWLSFLKDYFSKTLRDSRQVEEVGRWPEPTRNGSNGTHFVAGAAGSTGGDGANVGDALAAPDKPISSLDKPISGLDKPISGLEGGGCGCSVKNYPTEFLIYSPRAKGPFSKDKLPAAQTQVQPALPHG